MNVLPEIVMPSKEPEPEPEVAESILPESGDGNMELIDELHQEKQVDDIITVTERDVPEEDDVFGEPPTPKVTPLDASEAAEPAEEQPEEFPAKKGKRKYTRKAPMSEKQKEHLARIRKIAVEKRKAEKERKIKEKEEAVIEKAEKKILEKKRKEEEKQHVEQKKAQEIINNESKPQNGFTKADLDSAVLSAISQYDTLRKQEKKEKRAKEAKAREEEKMRATLARAIQPQKVNPSDPYRQFFT